MLAIMPRRRSVLRQAIASRSGGHSVWTARGRGMRAKGITYDTGFISNGVFSRPSLDPEMVEHELRIIRDDLHCNAVRVTGGDPDRLELAATIAADLGLEVWFSPYPLELTTEEMLALFAECAE